MCRILGNKLISLAARSALLFVMVAIAASTGIAQTVVVPVNGGTAGGTRITINTGPGDQFDPHVSGDLMSYTDATFATIRYFDFIPMVDGAIPKAALDVDSLSDVSGTRIVFSRATGTRRACMVYDTSNNSLFEVDPQPTSQRFGAAVGGNTVAFVDMSVGSGDIRAFDLATSVISNLSASTEVDENPAVAPGGNVVVWERCPTPADCAVWKAIRGGGIWGAATLVSNSAGSDSNPDTDGTTVVYDSNRSSATGRDIYYQPILGGAETQLTIPGEQRNPNISAGAIAFESIVPSGLASDLYVYVISTNTLLQVTNTPTVNELLNDVTVLANGDIRVVWAADDGVGGELNIYAQTFTPPAPPLVAVTPINGGIAGGTQVVVNNGPGDQTDPHVSGDLVSYTHATAAEIGYYSFLTNANAVIPKAAPGDLDTLSDVSGARIAFSRGFLNRRSSMVFDSDTNNLYEIAPQAGTSRAATAIGGNTVAFVEQVVGNGDVFAYDLASGGPPIILGASQNSDLNPGVAPSGDAIVWERCSSTDCSIWKSMRGGGIWGAATLVSNSSGHDRNADTDGTAVVYDSDRSSATGADIYYQPLLGGAETQLAIPGPQRNPGISAGVMVFESQASLASASDVYVYIISTNTLLQVTDTPTVSETLSDITVLPGGDIRVVWAADDGLFGESNIYALTFTPGALTYAQVSAGYLHTCALRGNGVVECWGNNSLNQAPATRTATAGSYTAVSAGTGHSCALTDAGVVECWGNNLLRQAPGRRAARTGTFTGVSAGGVHTCALRTDGVVECWGSNLAGQAPSTRSARTGRFTQVAAGGLHTCALRNDGVVECWGSKSSSQAPAVRAATIGTFVEVTAGATHSCATRRYLSGTGASQDGVECWGNNVSGQATSQPGSFLQISGGGAHTCGISNTPVSRTAHRPAPRRWQVGHPFARGAPCRSPRAATGGRAQDRVLA